MSNEQPRIDATALSQYVRLHSCQRFLWYRIHQSETRKIFSDYKVTEQPLTPLLRARGARHEDVMEKELLDAGITAVDLTDKGVEITLGELKDATADRALLQPRLEGNLGLFKAAGIADLIIVRPQEGGGLDIEIQDAKASRKDRPEHRLQVAFYAVLIRQMAEAAGLEIGNMTGAIWRIPSGPDDEQPAQFDLELYEEAVHQMVDDAGNATVAALASREEADYHLTYKCDGCMYNALCMREAAEEKELTLVPFLTQRDRLALRRHGVQDVRGVAELKIFAEDGKSMIPAEGVDETLKALGVEWPLGANLDLYIQRARAVARAHGDKIDSKPWIVGSGFGSMPDSSNHANLVKVFIDSQHDYLEDAVYLLAALAVAPSGESREVIEMTEEPPTLESEGALIETWVTRLLSEVRHLSGSSDPILHIYVYDSYDQKVLLDALRRHLDRLASIPDFFDVLTETPALTQSMFSFLADEVKERKNLGILCHSLPMVARRIGFDWERDGVSYWKTFQAKVFDNRRRLEDGTWYESAARFNSQIPLEYAYGTWRELPDDEEDRRLLEPFKVSRNDLLGFQRLRLQALKYIEESFGFKNRFLNKTPIQLPSETKGPVAQPTLADLLVEFLYVEHHALLQSLLLLYALPVDRRAATGSTIHAEALHDAGNGRLRLAFRFGAIGLDQPTAVAQMNPKEGDWMVLNPASGSNRPWDILRGRLVIIREITDSEIEVDLTTITFYRNHFRYRHNKDLAVAKGGRYTLDPMADDLVAERLLDACRNAGANHFLGWIQMGGSALPLRNVDEKDERLLSDFADAIDDAPRLLSPTARQRKVIAESLAQSIVLVQGPPGTGKTHTVAWAILARLFVAIRTGAPCHVLITSMTHTALEVLLRSLIEKVQELIEDPATTELGNELARVSIFKETSDPSDPVPVGITRIGRDDLDMVLNDSASVVAAVPGGVHRLLKGRNSPIDWTEKLFDLLVIDEASQVSLPAAVVGGAALKPDGQAIVVGDHRQMPPILVHKWEDEPRRGVQDHRIYSSTFEALRDRGFAQIGLDQSFRLHQMHADFLESYVYRDDAVGFHSQRVDLIPSADGLDPYVAAALHPEYPVVVIEHTEADSLKLNQTEANILIPIVEAAFSRLGLDGIEGVGVVVPHRAQRAALKQALPDMAASIDTVERFQGGERDLIIVSATASDPDFVLSEVRFLLNPNRLNVAFSRPRKKLIVIGSTTVFRLLPPDMRSFEDSLLWKRLRYEFSADILWDGPLAGATARISGRRIPSDAD